MIEIRKIDAEHQQDAQLPNEPFAEWGRMIPSLRQGVWEYQVVKFDREEEVCFPDVRYDVSEENTFFYGAYEGDTCVGLAVLRREMFKYLYLDDLKIRRAYRRQGIGSMLIRAGMDQARELGLVGMYTVGQDNNLSACLFYLKQGFQIGGFDNRTYRGTVQEHKADIYFYKDC